MSQAINSEIGYTHSLRKKRSIHPIYHDQKIYYRNSIFSILIMLIDYKHAFSLNCIIESFACGARKYKILVGKGKRVQGNELEWLWCARRVAN